MPELVPILVMIEFAIGTVPEFVPILVMIEIRTMRCQNEDKINLN